MTPNEQQLRSIADSLSRIAESMGRLTTLIEYVIIALAMIAICQFFRK